MRALLALVLVACGSAPPPASAPAPAPAAPAEHAHDHHAGHMHHRFENAEQWAKVFDDPARDAWQEPDKVIAALALTPAMTVADVGAGTGYFTMRLARAVPQGQVIATDIEPDMIRYLEDRARREGVTNVRAVTTPPDDPQLGKAAVDRVLVVDVWHHLTDRIAFAKHLAASLRPGGSIAIVDFKLDAKRGPPPKHRLAPDAIIADLTAVGLTAKVELELADQYVVIAR